MRSSPETATTQLATAEQPSTTLARRQQRQEKESQLNDFFAALYSLDTNREQLRFNDEWQKARRGWLDRQKSAATRRAYESSLQEWEIYLREAHGIGWLWMAEALHVVGWIDHMRKTGSVLALRPHPLKSSSINRHLAGVSAFYNYACSYTRLADGYQVGLMVDATGRPRTNPFHSDLIERPAVTAYSESVAIPTAAMQWVFGALGRDKSLVALRDYALLLTFYRSGYRADSVLRMKWGDLSEIDNPKGAIYRWQGKGGKIKNKRLPVIITNAIIAYLKAAGRYAPGKAHHIQADDCIWRPTRCSGRLLGGVEAKNVVNSNKAITQSTATEILHRHLWRYYYAKLTSEDYGRTAARTEAHRLSQQFHLHSLRHTFARELARAGGDLRLIRDILDHESLSTTQIYLGRIEEPEDHASKLLEQHYGI